MMRLLIGILAAWRLTALLVDEDGPGDLFARLRDLAGVRFDEYGTPYAKTVAGKALLCPRCTSVWAAGIVMLLPEWARAVLAVSAGAIIVNQWMETK